MLKNRIEGETKWQYDGPKSNMYDAEPVVLFDAVRTGKTVNDGVRMVRSTMLSLLGQMVCYTGQQMTWEQALTLSESAVIAGRNDWRLPNIKELQSLNDESLSNPSVDRVFFPSFVAGRFWSSTSQYMTPARAWYVDFQYGIASYEVKTTALNMLCVRDGAVAMQDSANEVLIPGGEFEMGDHHGFVDQRVGLKHLTVVHQATDLLSGRAKPFRTDANK